MTEYVAEPMKRFLQSPFVLFFIVFLVSGCTQKRLLAFDTESECPSGGCVQVEISEFEPRSAVSWEASRPEFRGFFQVVDQQNHPIEGAKLRIDGRIATSNSNGEVTIDDLPVATLSAFRVEHDEYVTTAKRAAYDRSGLGRMRVSLIKKPPVQSMEVDRAVTVGAGGASWAFPEQAFVKSDGSRVRGAVQSRMITIIPSGEDDSVLPGDNMAVAKDGAMAMIRRKFGVVMTEITDMDDKPLHFAAGVSAVLSLRLPSRNGVEIEENSKLGLYSLDLKQARWVRESSCEVVRGEEGEASCVGTVEHFSYWLVAEEWDIYDPEHFGCVNVTVDTSGISELMASTDRKGRSPWVGYRPLERCDDSGSCRRDDTFYFGQRAYVAPTEKYPHPSMCGVTKAGSGYRMSALVVRPEASSFMMQQSFALSSLQGVTDGERMINQMLDPERDCRTLCQQVVIKPTPESLFAGLTDSDRDGFFTASDEKSSERLVEVDCDDSDPATYPGAPDDLCMAVDRNCDGRTPVEDAAYAPGTAVSGGDCVSDIAKASPSKPLCPWIWNRNCGQACFERGEEVAGNSYDENCDGVVVDEDGDGFDSAGDLKGQRDCNDHDARSHPGGTEIPGNFVDEDCDGLALDYDGDGFFAYGHELVAAKLGLDIGADTATRFGDCNDFDSDINPGITAQQEAGQIASAYYFNETGPIGRKFSFCDYFNANGEPSSLFRREVRDLNCDGVITDADGDGLTAPGDLSLGEALDVDCDDFDPRLSAEVSADGELTCKALDRGGLLNDSECAVNAADGGEVTPLRECPVLASRIQTDCAAVTDAVSLCVYEGWNDANPLRLTPGMLWGPCDGTDRLLPDCPAGSTCGSGLTYSEGLAQYLLEAFTGGVPLEYRGICFPRCTEPTIESRPID